MSKENTIIPDGFIVTKCPAATAYGALCQADWVRDDDETTTHYDHIPYEYWLGERLLTAVIR